MGDMPLRRASALIVLVAVLPLAIVTSSVVRHGEGFAMPSGSSGRALLLVAGLGPAVAGLLHLWRRPGLAPGALLLGLAGAGWLVAEWDNPSASSDEVFTTGLTLWTVGPVLLTHAALAYPTGRLKSWPARLLVAAGYLVTVGLQGVATAAVFDPVREGCSSCPENLLAVAADPVRHQQLDGWGVRAGAVWAGLAVLVVGMRLVRDGSARRRSTGLILGATAVGLLAVAAYHVRNLDRGYLGSEQVDRDLWMVQGWSLVAVSVAVVVDLVRQRRAHRALTGLVVDLSDGPASGSLEPVLAARLGDPGVRLCFPLDGAQRSSVLVDSAGRLVDPTTLSGRRTELRHGGRHLATLVHRPGVLAGEDDVAALVSAVHLGLDHERLQAQALAQLADLRESGRRILDAGDAERRALERDLHDGAQQRLVGLSLGMRLLRSRGAAGAALDQAEDQVQAAVESLRALGRGLYPVLLDDAGLGPALRALAETGDLRVGPLPEERFSRAVETTAYLLVARACDAGPVGVSMTPTEEGLGIQVTGAVLGPGLEEVADRVTTLGGRWTVSDGASGNVLDVWVPR